MKNGQGSKGGGGKAKKSKFEMLRLPYKAKLPSKENTVAFTEGKHGFIVETVEVGMTSGEEEFHDAASDYMSGPEMEITYTATTSTKVWHSCYAND